MNPRIRQPMLYPLSYEGNTRFSSPHCSCRHNVSATFWDLFPTMPDYSPLFKHVDRSR
jgi:hypothetical protein